MYNWSYLHTCIHVSTYRPACIHIYATLATSPLNCTYLLWLLGSVLLQPHHHCVIKDDNHSRWHPQTPILAATKWSTAQTFVGLIRSYSSAYLSAYSIHPIPSACLPGEASQISSTLRITEERTSWLSRGSPKLRPESHTTSYYSKMINQKTVTTSFPS